MASTLNRADIRNLLREQLEAWYDTVTLRDAVLKASGFSTLTIKDDLEKGFLKGGSILEAGSEIMRVVDMPDENQSVRVQRGYRGTTPESHAAGREVKVHPGWGWTDYELNAFIIPNAIRWLKPYAWVPATTSDFTWSQNAREATPGSGIAYPDGHYLLKVQYYDSSLAIYRPFHGWQLVGSKLYFRETAGAARTLRAIYTKFQAVLSDDTTAMDNDDFAEPCALYGAHLCLNQLKTNRVRFAEYSAALGDRASTPDELIRVAYDIKNQAILERESRGRTPPANFASTYLE